MTCSAHSLFGVTTLIDFVHFASSNFALFLILNESNSTFQSDLESYLNMRMTVKLVYQGLKANMLCHLFVTVSCFYAYYQHVRSIRLELHDNLHKKQIFSIDRILNYQVLLKNITVIRLLYTKVLLHADKAVPFKFRRQICHK